MFEYLKHFDGVIVTGPHRSGTTISSKIIAHETGMPFHIEAEIEQRFGMLVPEVVNAWIRENRKKGFVLQGASYFNFLTEIQHQRIACVYVVRQFDHICSSQYRANQGKMIDDPTVKRHRWVMWDRNRLIIHPFEIHYEDLKQHPMFVRDRAEFKTRQIEPGGPDLVEALKEG